MSLDLTLLRLCTTRSKFDQLVPNASREGLDELTVLMLDALRAYYREFPDTKEIPFDVFDGWAMEFRWKTQPDDKKSLLKVLLKQMREPVPPEAAQGMIEKLLELELATTAVSKIVQWNGGAEFSLRDELYGLAETITDRMDRKARLPLVQDTPEELMQMDEHDVGIHFRLAPLARNLRALRGGDFGIYAMRPDSGKSLFLASESSHWITQLDNVWPDQKRTGVWLNNEGPGKRIKQRWYQSLLGATIPEMVEWAKDGSIRKRIEDAMGGDIHRMQFYDIHGFNSGEVEAIIKQANPGFIIFDMIDNITFSGGMTNGGQRTDQMLESMYQTARNWCVKYDAVGVAASQISAEGEGIQYPPQSALKDSKCFAAGTPVRMYDGTVKNIEDIQIGEQVMGIDGTPRNVVGTGSGEEPMYRVSGKGWYFDCNLSHNLVVQNRTQRVTAGLGYMEMRDMSLREFVSRRSSQDRLTAVRCSIPYQEQDLPMDPYLFGLWLGDGAQRECRITSGDAEILEYLQALPTYRRTYKQESNCCDVYFGPRSWLDSMGVRNNKHIPQTYKTSSKQQRLALLAGLMDSDGYRDHGSCAITMSVARDHLVKDIAEVARSLGYRTSMRYTESNRSSTVTFANTDELPVLLSRKSGVCVDRGDRMKVTELGWGKYYGITVDGDSRYCHADYIALRNTGKQGACDFIIMGGKLNDPAMERFRYIGTPKNKLQRAGGKRDVRQEVMMDAERARFYTED